MGQGGSAAAGAQLEDRYFLQKVKLGQGSFGTVWRAVDRQGGNTVAIKQLDKATLPRRGVTRQDIEREISMMRACSHENITRLFDTFEDASSIYLALEYCDGGDFGDKVKERGMSIGEREVSEWTRQMCAAIAALHTKGVCHRDIKPDNFMVAGAQTLKLSDFGLAVFLPRGKLLQEKCGTPAFMAPEQHNLPKRSKGYGFPADMWAAGVSMYMVMFGGKHPFLNDRGHLDDSLLLTGELDLRDKDSYKGFFGFGAMNLRFSDEARRLCKAMVEPEPGRRLTAEDAVSRPWMLLGVETGASPSGSPSPPLPREDVQAVSQQRSGTPRRTPPRGAGEGVEPAPAPQVRRAGTDEAAAAAWAMAPFPSPNADKRRAATPGPEGRLAIVEAAKLKDENTILQAELEERKRREELLIQQQRQLQERQKLLQRQRTKELQLQNDKLVQQEKELQRIEQEKQDLQRRHSGKGSIAAAAAATAAADCRSLSEPLKGSGQSRHGYLRRGTKCRYESGTYGWMNAVVQGYNDSDGTYNLDVRQHAALDKIAPVADVEAIDAWPPRALAQYKSTSVNQWLPAVVTSFNEADGSYNLDVRDHADVDRIRARAADRPAGTSADDASAGGGKPSSSAAAQSTQMGEPPAPVRGHSRRATADTRASSGSGSPARSGPHGGGTSGRDGSKMAPLRVSDLEATAVASMTPQAGSAPAAPPRKVGANDRCVVADHGLVVIESLHDGTYMVKTTERRRLKVRAEEMRAPEDAQSAWPPGTKVSYQSSSLGGKWIDANVVSFNPLNGTYNLDVRMEAAPDKVRPR